jgi:hypothetical protein
VEYKGLGDILCSLFLITPDYGRKNFMSSLHFLHCLSPGGVLG